MRDDLDSPDDVERAFHRDQLIQIPSFQILHHEVRSGRIVGIGSVGFARVNRGDDMRMLKLCYRARFRPEAIEHPKDRAADAENLQGDGTVQLDLLGFVNDPHAADAEPAQDSIVPNDQIMGIADPNAFRLVTREESLVQKPFDQLVVRSLAELFLLHQGQCHPGFHRNQRLCQPDSQR